MAWFLGDITFGKGLPSVLIDDCTNDIKSCSCQIGCGSARPGLPAAGLALSSPQRFSGEILMHKSGFLLAFALIASTFAAEPQGGRYLLLATSRTSTMEKELNQAAADGYRLNSVIGGDVGGGEVITVMEKVPEKGRYGYKL